MLIVFMCYVIYLELYCFILCNHARFIIAMTTFVIVLFSFTFCPNNSLIILVFLISPAAISIYLVLWSIVFFFGGGDYSSLDHQFEESDC